MLTGSRATALQRLWWVHPLLIAAFPPLYLFAANLGEQLSLDPLLAPLAISVGGTGLVLLLVAGAVRVVGGSLARASLVVSLAVILFFAYGHVWRAVHDIVRLQRYLLVIWAILAVAGLVAIVRVRPRVVRTLTSGLTVIALVLLALNVVPIARFALSEPGMAPAAEGPQPSAGVAAASAPDIWYLVFDRYAGQDALDPLYGFDNRPFLDQLERRGFDVVEHATPNYLKTALSLASTLQMDYLDLPKLAAEADAPNDWKPLYRILQGAYPVETYLHERGYTYLHLGVRRGATYTNSAADRVFLYDDHTEFGAVLADTTMLVALGSILDPDVPVGTAGIYGLNSQYELGMLEQIARADPARPRFIFAHVLLPHPPYVFNADGTWVTDQQRAGRSEDEQYLEQVRFVNDRFLHLLDLIDEHAGSQPPVILLQADEGPFPQRYAQDEDAFVWPDATDAELLRKFSILSASRIPGSDRATIGLTETTTPVNSFRIIFNAVFDTGLALLPDRNYVFTDQRHIYDEIDLTDRIGAGR